MQTNMITAAALLVLGLSHASKPRQVLDPSKVDVFVPVHKANCVTSKMVDHLNTYLQPKRILVATPAENCPVIEKYAANVLCMDQDKVMAGNVTKEWISSRINDLLNQNSVADATMGYGGHSTTGWYLQQFLKLGVIHSPLLVNDPLSEVYLVWDSDMILVNNFELFDDEGRIPLMAGGNRHSFSFLQMDGTSKYDSKVADSCNYHVVFKELTGLDMVNAPGGHGYVPHHMVMRKSFVNEMLESFGGKDKWVENILEKSCGKGRDYTFCQCGFSEYYSMASFLKHRHPDDVFDRPSNYTRYKSSSCCPHSRQFKRNSDKLFVGFEQGQCDDDSDQSTQDESRALRR